MAEINDTTQTNHLASNENTQQEEYLAQVETLAHDLRVCKEEVDDWKEKYTRLMADFQNYQKRIEKEHAQFKRSMLSSILLDYLTVLDNFERALKTLSSEESAAQWRAGIDLIYKDMERILEKYGVKPMTLTQEFDPAFHEAIAYVKSDAHSSGQIVQIFQQGYLLDGQVLRPAKVSVAQ